MLWYHLPLLITTLLFPSIVYSHEVSSRHFNMEISAKTFAPDGFSRRGVAVNGQFPGPAITASTGENIQVTVNNRLDDATMRRSTSIVIHSPLFQLLGLIFS